MMNEGRLRVDVDNAGSCAEDPSSNKAENSIDEIGVERDKVGSSTFASPDLLISRLHTCLIKAGHEKYCFYDENAIVLSHSIGSEHEQKSLIKATIESADKFAIITSYGIRPIAGKREGQISDTMFAILESLAKRQNDKDFSFVFFYNKSLAVQNFILKRKCTEISMNDAENAKGTPSWPQVVNAYNAQQTNESLKIKTLRIRAALTP